LTATEPGSPTVSAQAATRCSPARHPAPVWLRPGGTAYFGINKNACTIRDVDLATVIRVIPPGAQSALTLPAPSQRIMDYCGRGVAGSVVDISPVEPDIAAVFAHH
jgi:hypothetical protein